MYPGAEKQLIYEKDSLYVFDFDGTLYRGDSMIRFLQFSCGKLLFYIKLLKMIYPTLLFILKKIDKTAWKETFLQIYLKDKKYPDLQLKALAFAEKEIKRISVDAINFINEIKVHNKVIIISASLDLWLIPLTNQLEIDVICTKSKIENECFTGIKGHNINGIAKKNVIKYYIHNQSFNKIISFGNSSGDTGMYSISDHFYHKFFF